MLDACPKILADFLVSIYEKRIFALGSRVIRSGYSSNNFGNRDVSHADGGPHKTHSATKPQGQWITKAGSSQIFLD